MDDRPTGSAAGPAVGAPEGDGAAIRDSFEDLIQPFQHRGIDLKLGRLEQALAELGHPEASFPAVQVAGTNGKGSICTLVASALTSAGLRTGLYTSPHLLSWSERLRINGAAIADTQLRHLLERLQPCGQRHQLTPFEWITAAAFVHFAAAGVDLAVLEVGLGGRLDATTVHPQRPVIGFASIGLDHREVLGPDLASIAVEKAGVLSPGAVAVSGPQSPEVEGVLTAAARRVGAELRWVDPARLELDGSLAADGLIWRPALAGAVQRTNSAVALGLLRALQERGWAIADQAIAVGFAQAHWPGRLQTARWAGSPVLLDGAHNPPAAIALRAELDHRSAVLSADDEGRCFVLGMLANKQAPRMLEVLLRPQDHAWIVPVVGHACWDVDGLRQACPPLAARLRAAESTAAALDQILSGSATSQPPPPSIVVAGSLYLLADLLRHPRLEARAPH
ncbi:MAG: bifunctional folylpolyglutamate synthase/dihydrofolate synthase [Cyanobacteriota bacterium]